MLTRTRWSRLPIRYCPDGRCARADQNRGMAAWLRGLSVVLILGSAALAAAPGVLAAPRGGTAEILFSRKSFDGVAEHSSLYLIAPPDTKAHMLAVNAAEGAVSPNGDRIAFVRGETIWLMRRDGSRQRQLTKPATLQPPSPPTKLPIADQRPAWSADAKTIYFSRWVKKAGLESIFSIRVDGTNLRRVTRPEPSPLGHCHTAPAPSPDGRTIAYQDARDCNHGSDWRVVAVSTSGKRVRLPFRFPVINGAIEYDPAWASDGRRLAYAVQDSAVAWHPRTSRSGIYVSAADSSPARRIVAGFVSDAPHWSKDSRWIVFALRSSYGDRDIWVVHSDGTGLTRLTRGHAEESEPVWLPPAR